MEISLPFLNIKLNAKVIVLPHQINQNINLNIKNNLATNVVKTCIKEGYVSKVKKIISIGEGKEYTADYNASFIFDVLYVANICIPVVGTLIIGKVKKMTKTFVACFNGPIDIIIQKSDVSPEVFHFNNNNDILYSDSERTNTLQVDDFVIIEIQNVRFNIGDMRIRAFGLMLKVASEKERVLYYQSKYGENKDKDFK